MSKRLDPEIKALRALSRAMDTVPIGAEQRCLEWLVASRCSLPGVSLPAVRGAAPVSPLASLTDAELDAFDAALSSPLASPVPEQERNSE